MAMSIFDFPKLLRVVESFPRDSSYLTDTFSSVGEYFDTDVVEIQTKKGHRPLAPYVNELLPGKVVARSDYTSSFHEPALLKPARNITRHDIKVARAGENVYNPKTPQERYNDLVTKDMVELNETLSRREAQQLAEIMFTGKTVQIGEGVDNVLDWNFTNIEVLSGTDLFSNDDVDVVKYLREWKMEVMKKSGLTMRRVLTTSEVGDRIVGHPSVLALIDAKKETLNVGNLNQEILPDGLIYHGTLAQVGLEIWSYTNSYTDEEGVEVDYIPAGTLAMLPNGQPFTFHYGANVIMGDDDQIKFIQARVIPQVITSKEPVRRTLQLLSKPICVPNNVDGWFVAKVLA